jgi:hypothetical protein
MTDLEERFWSRVQKEEGCWCWAGPISVQGYARLKVDGRPIIAHRLSYEIARGEIPTGYHVHHDCHNKACVNPDHLVALPASDHAVLSNKGTRKPRNLTHCKHGHEMTPENSYTWKNMRRCKTCNTEAQWRRRHRVENG